MADMKETALLRWKKNEALFACHRRFLAKKKPNSQRVEFEDLLHLRNFKGGNGQIAADPLNHQKSLTKLSEILRAFDGKWGKHTLRALSDDELDSFTADVLELVESCREPDVAIKGLGSVRVIALLAVHHPDLVPVLDVNVLAATNLSPALGNLAHNKFPQFCKRCRTILLKNPALSLRALDRNFYIKGVIKVSAIKK